MTLIRFGLLGMAATFLVTMAIPGRCELKDNKPDSASPDLSKGATLYTVGYAHLDTQWRWDYPQVINSMIPATMHDNFRLIEAYPNYIFNFSGANRYRLMKEYYPADFEKVKAYVKAGRWFPCGSSMEESDVNVPSAESLIRQILYGNHYFRRELGKASIEYMLPDCFGFPASLPSILAHCGIKGFSTQKLTWGSAVGIPFKVGVWEGLDGSFVIAALDPGDYGGRIREDLSQNKNWLERINQNGKTSGVFADYRYYGTGDQGGAPTEDSVKWVEKSVSGIGPIKIISSSADQLFKDIKPSQIAGLPRYKGDLLLTQHSAGSLTSQAYMKKWNRHNEQLADGAEKTLIAASWLGGMIYPQKKLNDAWTLVMGGQFHDILPGTSIPKAYEYSWNDEILAMNQFSNVMEQAVGVIASAMDTRAKGTPIVIYNPLNVAREDLVEATVPLTAKSARVIGPDGKETPSQIIDRTSDGVKVLFVAKAPSVGFAVYDVQPSEITPKSGNLKVTESSLENARYKIKLNNAGDVSSIYDKLAKNELLSAPMCLAFQYENPREFPAWNMDWEDQSKPPHSYVDGKASIGILENGPVRVAVAVTREAEGSKFTQIVRLSAGSAGNRIEFSDQIDWRSRECCLKAVFPLTVSNPLATYSWETCSVQRGNNDPAKYEVPSHQWFDLTDKEGAYGVSALSDCKYGSDKPDDSTLRLTLLHTPGTRGGYHDQASQDWGKHKINYGLAGHSGDWREGQTDWQALRMQQPLIAFETIKHEGKLGKKFAILKLSDPRIRVLAVKKAEDTDEVILRMVEMDGKKAKSVKISFAAPITTAREVNGQEQPIGLISVKDSALDINFTPYQIRTFALKLGEAPTNMLLPKSTPVTLKYDIQLTSKDGEKSNGGFDKDKRCIPAEMLPSEITESGITFKLGPNDQPNGVTCSGQTITLPKAKSNRVYILAASSPEDQKAIFTLDGEPIELNIQDWGGYIGQWDLRTWKPGTDECNGIIPGYIRPEPVAWFCSHRHNANGQNEVYAYSYLFRYSISAPKGAAKLMLPDNNKIKILAISLADIPTPVCAPAQPLMDTL
ncbi:MAG: glycosyl hydrolase-related protein [Armatimonadetes bacterium]|nr:glycosyl hydrolase-related protein [Armatimonadota bacterium]